MPNLRGGVGGWAKMGRRKSQKPNSVLIASFYWLEGEIQFYGWLTPLPIISLVFGGGRKERITCGISSFKEDGREE
jgi:hypothetical protein